MLLSDILVDSCNAMLPEQKSDGSFPPGWNGPYHDPETPARNTAHWLIMMLKAYQVTKSPELRNAALEAAEFLISPTVRPMGAAFYCRTNPEKDFCNGLIGQAWIIEALIVASDVLNIPQYEEVAQDVFLMHAFDHECGLWQRLNVDGSYSTYDMTFNHQLWFAAVGAMLRSHQSGRIRNQITCFLQKANTGNFKVARSGRISHLIRNPARFERFAQVLRTVLHPRRQWKNGRKICDKENGYHAFNLYAFAMLKQSIPDHVFWENTGFRSALSYINSPHFSHALKNCDFAYPYNPAGFEVAFTLEVFSTSYRHLYQSPQWWVNKQLEICFDHDSRLLNRNTMDKLTLASRLYEATRLSDMKIEFSGDGDEH